MLGFVIAVSHFIINYATDGGVHLSGLPETSSRAKTVFPSFQPDLLSCYESIRIHDVVGDLHEFVSCRSLGCRFGLAGAGSVASIRLQVQRNVRGAEFR